MSFNSIVPGLKDMKDGIWNNILRRKKRSNRTTIVSRIVPLSDTIQGQWANLPLKMLMDIIRRVEESETSWPAHSVIISCASVCKSWREITKHIVKTPQECGRLTFPISLKQPGPRESPIQCFMKWDRANSFYRLYSSMTPLKDAQLIFDFMTTENATDKLLLAAKMTRKLTSADFVISLVADDFSQASNTYVGKLRSNFLETKFNIYDSLPPSDAAFQQYGRRFHEKQVFARGRACNHIAATVSYEAIACGTPMKMHCTMHSIPFSSIQEGSSAPTPTSLTRSFDKKSSQEPIVLKTKAPWWDEKSQSWWLNFKGRVTVASEDNFQLLAAVDASRNIPVSEQEKVILQFGKIGEDVFIMDYCYPLSAFQAFGICLSNF